MILTEKKTLLGWDQNTLQKCKLFFQILPRFPPVHKILLEGYFLLFDKPIFAPTVLVGRGLDRYSFPLRVLFQYRGRGFFLG